VTLVPKTTWFSILACLMQCARTTMDLVVAGNYHLNKIPLPVYFPVLRAAMNGLCTFLFLRFMRKAAPQSIRINAVTEAIEESKSYARGEVLKQVKDAVDSGRPPPALSSLFRQMKPSGNLGVPDAVRSNTVGMTNVQAGDVRKGYEDYFGELQNGVGTWQARG